METREVFLKADRIVVALERLEDGKTRATTASWDDHNVYAAALPSLRGTVRLCLLWQNAIASLRSNAASSSARSMLPGRPSLLKTSLMLCSS
jgi:hypothetical protein